MKKSNNYSKAVKEYSRQMNIIIKSMFVGLLAGLISSAYRFLLLKTESAYFTVFHFFRNHLVLIPLLFLFLACLGLLTSLMVKHFPLISGSGIPQVKGILSGYITQNWFTTLVGKFAGGILAILAGLSLGREGPSIQLGASVAEGLADKFSDTKFEKKILIASGAGAGLAAAFNAPLAGALFALEEIYKYFSPIVCLSALAAAMVSDYVAKSIFGTAPVFEFGKAADIPLKFYWILILLGILLGIFGG
ncbi:chloride channel protein [Anaerocolumna jejuensis]|uniref:chloride channel protein n=1 Tax=Anaerocolumna jejuensis TaxID=259063 RepID=UPI003F7BED58